MKRIIDEVLWDRRTGLMARWWFPVVILCAIGSALLAMPGAVDGAVAGAWGYDFKAFRTGAAMTAAGDLAEAYDPAVFAEELAGHDLASGSGQEMFWMYPPHGAMIMVPFGLGPWWLSGLVLTAMVAGATYASGRMVGGEVRTGALLLFSVPAFTALLVGQFAPIFASLLVFALWSAKTRPILAGLALALLTAKPQYGLMVPVFLVATGNWRTIAAASTGTLALVFASLVAVGPGAWSALLTHTGGPAHAFIYDNLYASMPSLYQYARFLGAPAGAADAVQLLGIGVGAIVVFAARALPRDRYVALTLAVTCAAMPYLWFYDWLPLMAAIVILMRPAHGDVPRPLLLAVWLTPILSAVQEGLIAATPFGLAQPVTAATGALEAALVWALIAWTAYPATRTTALPVFAPWKRPMNASGPASTPS